VVHWCSSTTRGPPISIEISSPTITTRRRLRPHRGQHHSSSPEPPQHHKQHHIITLKLFDLSIGSLVHYRASPTLAGILPRRRRIGLRRSPSIQHVFIQLMAPTHSPCLTEAFAQVVANVCHRSSAVDGNPSAVTSGSSRTPSFRSSPPSTSSSTEPL
jgi:hypothetical protein